MAVVEKYTKAVKNPGLVALPAATYSEGRMRCLVSGPVAVVNGDSIDSRVWFGKVPSHAIILPSSILYHSAVTGLTDFDIGLYRDGALVDIDALADGLNLSSAGNKSVVAVLATGTIGRQLWQVAGLATDPGCEFDIVGTFKTAATADGAMEAFIHYVKK